MRQIYYGPEFPVFSAICIWNGSYYVLNGLVYYRTRKFGDIVYILVNGLSVY